MAAHRTCRPPEISPTRNSPADAYLRRLPNPGESLPAIEILGEIGNRYRLQSSSKLQDWFDIEGTLTISSDRPIVRLPPPSSSSNRFFRLVSP